VVRQFARVAHATGFMYIYPLLNAPPPTTARTEWQRAVLPGSNSDGVSALSELTSFFPFDPYKLPRSSLYIEPIYREWASVAIEGDDDEEEDEDEDEVQQEMQDGPPRPWRDEVDHLDVEADGLGASFGGMSISPVYGPAHTASANNPGIKPTII